MPHKRKPKHTKNVSIMVEDREGSDFPVQFFDDRENIVSKLSMEESEQIKSMIETRYGVAKDLTDSIAQKMDKWEKQYNGEWQDPDTDDERFFLPKSREHLQLVHAHIIHLVSQLRPLITFTPKVSSVYSSNEEYKRSKIAEALLNYYMDDVWKLRDDVFPNWLKTFLKFSVGVWKVTYHEDSFLPDLNISVVDRALLYFDPTAHDIRDARWVIEKYYLPRSEVIQRIEEGHWWIPSSEMESLDRGFLTVDHSDVTLKRFFGANYGNTFTVPEDEMIEVIDYWQAPTKGLTDVYAVMIGGIDGQLVRYGRNPYPYKGLPYRGKSFDPHEYQIDGTGLMEQYRPFQEVLNTFLNLRITDVRKNIIRPVAATGRFINAQTQQDFKDGHKIVRLDESILEASKDPAFDIRKHFVELPFAPTTQELLVADLPFLLNMGKESSSISDVFRGMNPQPGATLGQVQEQLSRNQGVFRPVFLQVMRSLEEIGEICFEYFKTEDFFPTERIVQIIGENRYKTTVQGWHTAGGNMSVRQVSSDEMDVDVTVNAVSGADALASRTFIMQSFEVLFQALGQVPQLVEELNKNINFTKLFEILVNASGHDTEAILLTDEEKQMKQQEQQMLQQQAMQQAMQQQEIMLKFQQQIEQMKAEMDVMRQQSKIQGQMQLEQQKAQLGQAAQQQNMMLQSEATIRQIAMKVAEELKADLVRMNHEFTLERQVEADIGHGNNVGK